MFGIRPYLVEHFFEVILGADPGGDRVAEEDEVLHDAWRVVLDHLADAAERRVLLLVVANVAQRRAPAMTSTQQPVRFCRPSVDCCTDMTHHCRMKRCSMGATCAGHTKPKRPMVIAAKRNQQT